MKSSKLFWWGVTLIMLFAMGGAAYAAPPGVSELHPSDPGYKSFPVPADNIDAPAYWLPVTQRSCGVPIADVDTGVAVVPDLAAAIKGVQSFVPDGSTTDVLDHGTSVASVLSGAINDGQGAAGLSNCPVIAAKVYDPAPTYWVDGWVANAINAMANQGVRVILVEVQAKPSDEISQTVAAIRNAAARNIAVVVPAGDVLYKQPYSKLSTAVAGIPGVIRVGSVQWDNSLGPHISDNSAQGPAAADIAAPGDWGVDRADGSVQAREGTSIAAPVVAGILAEMFNFNGGLSAVDAINKLHSSCVPATDWATKAPLNVAWGCYVDAFNALEAAGYVPPPPATLKVKVAGRGLVSDAATTIYCGVDSGAKVNSCALGPQVPGTREVLRVKAVKGWRFSKWSGACKGTKASCSLSLASGLTKATATFVRLKAAKK